MFLLERKFEENDTQLDLADMSLHWPRSSDEIVILRPRESSGIYAELRFRRREPPCMTPMWDSGLCVFR